MVGDAPRTRPKEIHVKLYSGPLSLFTAKIRIALAEKALPYERVEVSWSLADRYEPHHPDVIALNPRREVPVLIDGEAVISDSTVIFEYLEDAYPQTPLYPADPAGRARCRQLEAAADEILFPHVWDLIETSFYPSETPDEERSERAREGVDRYCGEREKDLADSPWLCSSYGAADIANFVMLNAATTLGAAISPSHAHLLDWSTRGSGRPAVAEELAELQGFLAKLFAG